ncbi:hypothetical protein JVT61DRAFT_4075 [Boletus reticuloceps]|uniref:NAD-dependent epimerase/dehydratase domain-containing protein n=1 Tax=Boletus reticuloceps TaxID=495285 RepID=A0A8I3A9L7_9AGAM|nr:hypothetical protein JVT61DRAFT_4075 [Boletus reticuloceps]
MHVLITGATGFIGNQVLFYALVDNRVSKVTVVGRHPPSLDAKYMAQAKTAIVEKLTIITRDDLSVWDFEGDPELVSALADCKACIWCVGGKFDDFATPEEYERVSYTFTLNAVHFLTKLAHSQISQAQTETDRAAQPLRFCYCSAKGANRNGTAGGFISVDPKMRNMKGRVEVALLSEASQSNRNLVVYIFRPGTVVSITTLAMRSFLTNVQRVAKVLVDAAVGIRVEWQRQGAVPKDTWESEEIISWSLGLGV